MKYRIKSLYIVKRRKIKKRLRAKRREKVQALSVLLPTLMVRNKESNEYINLAYLFEVSMLPPAQKRKRARGASIIASLKTAARAVLSYAGKVCSHIKKKFVSKKNKEQHLPFYAGALCATATIAVFCAVTVILTLFLPYMRSYTPLTVPDLVGESIEAMEASDDLPYELAVSYENSSDVKAGTIMSQKPDAGVIRKLYKNGEPCIISVTVSSGKSFYTVEALSGAYERDALLALYNKGVCVTVEYVHSDTAPKGQIISSSPAAGTKLYEGETLILTISLGKLQQTVSVPDLYGLSEAQARQVLEERSLMLGNVTYEVSSVAVGKTIRQQYSAYEQIPKGSAVDITVSLGNSAGQKYVPDLYGLNTEQAAQELAKVGLVIGSIYSVESGAQKGTVVTQTPIPNTPITSSITSVDIFISS